MRWTQRQDARKRMRDSGLNSGPGLRRNGHQLWVWLWLASWGIHYPFDLKLLLHWRQTAKEDRFLVRWGWCFSAALLSQATLSPPHQHSRLGWYKCLVQLLQSWAEDLRLAKNNHSGIFWVILNPAQFFSSLHHLPVLKEQWHNQKNNLKVVGRSHFRQHGCWTDRFRNKC